jgi:hypothetical protein
MRFTIATLILACASASAESPTAVFDKAPPQVEKALRERIDKFFQAHIEGKFRLAEQVVHEDSQDIFYNAQKQKYISYEIVKIDYAENFTKATVVTAVEMDWQTARLGRIRVKPPLKTLWKVDGGQWWWYAVPQKDWDTPFGRMTPGGEPTKTAVPQWTLQDPTRVLKQVEVSKHDIKLSSFEKSEDFAEIRNGMPGNLTLEIHKQSHAPGLDVKLSKTSLASGETARVTFTYNPADRTPKPTQVVEVRAVETNQVYAFNITFAVPPEMEKYLPKKQ